MAFQFQCPYGHLLAAEESQAGQQCVCPMCNTLFIIPAPLAPAAPGMSPYAAPAPQPPPEVPAPPPVPQYNEYPVQETRPAKPKLPPPVSATLPAEPSAADPASPSQFVSPVETDLLHIPCPNGHVLETPAEMLDQDVACPRCQAQFRLRRQDSVEYKKKKRDDRDRRERRKVAAWITAGVVVVLLVLGALFYMITQSSGG